MATRPIEWNDELLAKIEKLSAQCVSVENIARLCGMAPSAFFRHKKENPAIEEALKRGRSNGEEWATAKLRELGESGNAAALIFMLKTQFGWREKSAVDINANLSGGVNVKNDVTLNIKDMSDEQLQAIAAGQPISAATAESMDGDSNSNDDGSTQRESTSGSQA